jgi:hypothetical protein
MRIPSIAVAATIILMLALASAAMAADPFVGTWKLNVAKSKYSPGPPPKSATVKIEAQDNGLKIVANGVNAEGKPTHIETAFKYDGKDYPYTPTGGPSDLTVAVKRIDANTQELTLKQGGKVMQTVREVVSKDGKTQTRTIKGKNAQGQEVSNTIVFDKQ